MAGMGEQRIGPGINHHGQTRLRVASFRQIAVVYPFVATAWIAAMLTPPMIGVDTILGVLLAVTHVPVFAIGLALLTGLPLRLNQRLSRWWMGNGRCYILLAAAATLLMISGYSRRIRQTGVIDGMPYDEVTPDMGLVAAGCFIITFLAVNASLPLRFKKRTDVGSMAP
ncbi:hypothetical protein StoSoilB20_42750 [Arthrobacter sp. StoSoilB20]|nr:hypothetical protein StoSoilB20_42750 [Arthrobacter sp. StoSoilB20]